jgi:integrase
VKIVLKGLHRIKRKPDGFYFYAWRGGPRIDAEPNSPEFVAEFQRLTAARDKPQHRAGTMQALINQYQFSPAFRQLSNQTQRDYARRIRKIETEFGDMPLAAVADPAVRGIFLDWRDKIGRTTPREADYAFAVLARILSWAFDRRAIPQNPCERPGRLHSGDRAAIVWLQGEVDALLAVASPQVALVVHLAKETGQRQGDVLALTWAAYDGQVIRLRQSKTGRHLTVPVTADLRAVLDAARPKRKAAVTICTTSRGKPWTSDGFKSSFDTAKKLAQISGKTFHDLRGTAVLALARAGCTVPEICSITGHSLKTATAILDKHYFAPDRALGESAIAKLEKHRAGTETVKRTVKRSDDQPKVAG